MPSLVPPDELTLPPAAAFQRERTLFSEVTGGPRAFACELWFTHQCLVVTRAISREPRFARAVKLSEESGWPVLVRETGGGITPQGPGTLNISLAFRRSASEACSIEEVYRRLCEPILRLVRSKGAVGSCCPVPGSFCDGRFNVAVGGKKLAGTAQRWRLMKGEYAVFAHALLLIDSDINSSVAAVNRFNAAMGLEKTVRASAHTTLAELHPDRFGAEETASLVRELKTEYPRAFAGNGFPGESDRLP